MLTLKDIDPSEVQMVQIEVKAMFDAPQVECMCCHETAHPSKFVVDKADWLIAAHTCGWRQVETSDATYSMVCPGCVDELEAIEKDNEAFAKEQKIEPLGYYVDYSGVLAHD